MHFLAFNLKVFAQSDSLFAWKMSKRHVQKERFYAKAMENYLSIII
jgi:hypothetical protein